MTHNRISESLSGCGNIWCIQILLLRGPSVRLAGGAGAEVAGAGAGAALWQMEEAAAAAGAGACEALRGKKQAGNHS